MLRIEIESTENTAQIATIVRYVLDGNTSNRS